MYVPDFNTNHFSLNSDADRGSHYHGASKAIKVKDVELFSGAERVVDWALLLYVCMYPPHQTILRQGYDIARP